VGIDVDGGFAEQAVVPASCCWPAPAGMPDETLMLAEPLAVIVRAVRRGEPRPGESAAVLGAGTLGLLAVQVLRSRGVRVLAVSRSERRLPLAQSLGAEAVATTEGGVEAAARAFSKREGVDLVIETAGTAGAVAQAVEICRSGGRIVLTGLPHEPTPLNFFWVVRRELRIIGSMIYQDEFQEAVRLLAAGVVKADPLLTHRFRLDGIGQAFEAHRAPDSIKVALLL
jgi:2-desacetyl-2-hydroxyethyl bacteriochlorophyllide A dehydrogenase